MLARGGSVYGEFGAEEEGGYGSHEEDQDLVSENRRLKQEISRLRRHRDSVVDAAPRQEQHRSTLNNLVHGRAQEQLREVIEENEHLVERLKLKEVEIEEWRGDYTKLRQTFEEEQRKRFDSAEARLECEEHPKDIRLFKKKAQDVMKKIQEEKDRDLAKADQHKKLLKMQLDDSQARCAKGKAEIVRLERELSLSEASNVKKQASLDDLQHHYEELRGMLEDERRSAEQLRGKVLRLEEELEAERMHQSKDGGETLEMLDRFMDSRRSSIDSTGGELAHLADGESRQEPEICGQLKDQLVELQREYEQLRAQLATALRSQELAAEHEEELQRRLSDSEELRMESERLRSQRAGMEARLHEADEERALLRTQLAAAQKSAAEAAERSLERPHQPEVVVQSAKDVSQTEQFVGGGIGRSSQDGDQRRECEALRARLADVEEELSRAREAGRAAAAAADAPPGAGRAEDLEHECDRLREELATCRQARTPGCQVVQAPEEACSNCDRLLRQLASAQELQQELRREHEQLRRQLADSVELEQEHRRSAEHLRQQLAASPAEVPPPPPSATLQLAGTAAPGAVPGTADKDERSELLRRNQELLDAMQQLQGRAEAAAGDAAGAGPAEERSALQRQCCELRGRLHASKMAELEAQRRADAIPELMSKITELQKQVAAAEKSAAEWREVATDTSWSGVFSSFMCAAPERRRHPHS